MTRLLFPPQHFRLFSFIQILVIGLQISPSRPGNRGPRGDGIRYWPRLMNVVNCHKLQRLVCFILTLLPHRPPNFNKISTGFERYESRTKQDLLAHPLAACWESRRLEVATPSMRLSLQHLPCASTASATAQSISD